MTLRRHSREETLAGAAQDIVDGDGEAATGHEGFDAQMAALRKML